MNRNLRNGGHAYQVPVNSPLMSHNAPLTSQVTHGKIVQNSTPIGLVGVPLQYRGPRTENAMSAIDTTIAIFNQLQNGCRRSTNQHDFGRSI